MHPGDIAAIRPNLGRAIPVAMRPDQSGMLHFVHGSAEMPTRIVGLSRLKRELRFSFLFTGHPVDVHPSVSRLVCAPEGQQRAPPVPVPVGRGGLCLDDYRGGVPSHNREGVDVKSPNGMETGKHTDEDGNCVQFLLFVF